MTALRLLPGGVPRVRDLHALRGHPVGLPHRQRPHAENETAGFVDDPGIFRMGPSHNSNIVSTTVYDLKCAKLLQNYTKRPYTLSKVLNPHKPNILP